MGGCWAGRRNSLENKKWIKTCKKGDVNMREWEYKIVTDKSCDEEYINTLGRDGWDLVGISHCPSGPTLYFKREYYPAGQNTII